MYTFDMPRKPHRKPHNAYVLSTPAAAGLPNEEAEAAGPGDQSREEQLKAYIIALQKSFDLKMIESVKKSERIRELENLNQTLRRHIERQQEASRQMQHHKQERTEKIHEWRIQELQSKLRQANEAHEEQLAGWMQQVNALQKRIDMLERRST
jgi:hypothetical protein